jgi:3-oxoacyl-[acyl-carrier protein] reductase
MFALTGRNALVTGATGGIGGAIARTLHKAGAAVAISGRQVDKLEALADHGIIIRERVKVAAPTHSHNENYIRAKAEKSGHLF